MTRTIDIDTIISTWLSDGPEHAPEQRSQLALDQIDATPQSRSVLRPRVSADGETPRSWRLLASMAAAVVLAISIGIAFRTGLIGFPTASPVPVTSSEPFRTPVPSVPLQTPVPSARPDGAQKPRIAAAPDGSFEIELPSRLWNVVDGPDPTAVYLRHHATLVSIRAGDEDGRLLTCDEPAGTWEMCEAIAAITLDDLAAAIALSDVAGPTRTGTTLDGEPAMIEKLDVIAAPAPEHVAYITAVHNGRPYVMRFWKISPGSLVDLDGDISIIQAAFRFTD